MSGLRVTQSAEVPSAASASSARSLAVVAALAPAPITIVRLPANVPRCAPSTSGM